MTFMPIFEFFAQKFKTEEIEASKLRFSSELEAVATTAHHIDSKQHSPAFRIYI